MTPDSIPGYWVGFLDLDESSSQRYEDSKIDNVGTENENQASAGPPGLVVMMSDSSPRYYVGLLNMDDSLQ